ncbi:MAG: fibronectin type III domain-containing protein [Alcanivoracaceae bacterium]|nr:fibronectin type III domain-containing protein [Alcanivoracaceae bacterium]
MKIKFKKKLQEQIPLSRNARITNSLCILAIALSGCVATSEEEINPEDITSAIVEGASDYLYESSATDTTKPAVISTLSATTLSSNSLRLNWTSPGDDGMTGTAKDYDIRYNTSPIDRSNWKSSIKLTNEPAPQEAGTNQSVTVDGLDAGTEYFFTMKTSDESRNRSKRSNVASATTDTDVIETTQDTTAPAKISALSATVLSTSSVRLNWTAPGDDDNSGTASSYDIRFANVVITNGNWNGITQAVGESNPGAAGDAQSFTINGLNANSQYFFAIKTQDKAGNESILSNVVSGTTLANTSGAATTPGTATSPYPTIKHLSIEWPISGDNDEDGVVSVRYRQKGSSAWKKGMDLFRVPAGSNEGFSWKNKHSGSLFNLAANTEYDIELTLDDPDNGSTIVQTLNARTRAVPQAAAGAKVVNVTPSNFSNALSNASAGDLIVLGAGTYSGFTVGRDGAPGQPIVIRGANKNSVIINGDIRMDNRHDVYIESVTVNGTIKFNSSERIVVRGSKINTNGSGIVAQGNGTVNSYIADNVVLGSTTWSNNTVGNNGSNTGEGIELTGPGNVIAYNYVKGFRDCISLLEDDEAVNQLSFDIYNNDIEIGADDAIEADFAMGNVRVLNNRITNSYVGLSSQPSLGGPTYFIGNVLYNVVYTAFKLHRGSVGDVALHNTIVKPGDAFGVFTTDTWSHAYFRNNIFIGGNVSGQVGPYGIGSGDVANLRAAASNTSFDFDAYGSIGGSFSGRIGSTTFSSLNTLRNNTTETHAQQVDMSIFAGGVTFPDTVFPARGVPDLFLKSGTAVIDAGVVIPNINDGYTGSAPDLGAYELGGTQPTYGPRS